MSAWKLIIEDDAGKQIVVPFTRDVITIGRKEGNTIRLTERNVSRNHAKLSKANGHVVLEDMKSFNGIKLNGDRIEGRVLVHEGDTIQIGDYHLAIHAQESALAATMPPTNGQGAALNLRGAGAARAPGRDDDEFAGDTQRWEPPQGMPGISVAGMPTQEDHALSDEHTAPAPVVTVRTTEPKAGGFGVDNGDTERVTMDMMQSLEGQAAKSTANIATRPRDQTELEPTVRQVTAPPPVSMPPQQPAQQMPSPHVPPHTPHPTSHPSLHPPSHPSLHPPSSNGHSDRVETKPEPRAAGQGAPPSSSAAPMAAQAQAPGVGPAAPPRTPILEARRVQDETTEAIRSAPTVPEELALLRLVVMNTIFAGSTFSLRAAEAVIGRTEDNDITIEHRSVSRNHAKIVREGDRVKILDLKSANGVLVNNEEVEQAVLRSGDVVELGRVKLRFVPVGERFIVPPDEIERARIADAAGDDFENDTGTGVTNPVRKKDAGASGPYGLMSGGEGKPNPLVLGAIAVLLLLALVAVGVIVVKAISEDEPVRHADAATHIEKPPEPLVPPLVEPPGAEVKPPVDVKPPPVEPPASAPPPPAAPVADDGVPPKADDTAPPAAAETERPRPPPARPTKPARKPEQTALTDAQKALLANDFQTALKELKPFEDSKTAVVHRTLGIAYAKAKNNRMAAQHYRRYLELNPEAPDRAGIEKALRGEK